MPAITPFLAQVLDGFAAARQVPLTGHPLAEVLTHTLADEISNRVGDTSYKISGSAGRGRWAETPWVAVFDRLVTEGAQRGFYAVYLFRPDGIGLYLSLNQGTTEVHETYGAPKYQDVLAARAQTFAGYLSDVDTSDLLAGSLELGGQGMLTRGYEAGNVVAVSYPRDALPDDERFNQDLKRFLALYQHLVENRDALVEDSQPHEGEDEPGTGTEARNKRWHLRAERSSRLPRQAKRYHGTTCQACGFTYPERYGDLGDGYIEAHHLTPFAQLEGRPTELDPKTDFAVLCANCHRMIHRQTPPLTIQQLKDHLIGG